MDMVTAPIFEKTRKFLKNKLAENCTRSSKFIIFNKSIMAKHPDIELDTASVFKSVIQMISTLDTDRACREHLERLRWNSEPVCPHCGSQRKNHYQLKYDGVFNGLHKCKDCRKRFTVTVGTIFHGSQISLRKWFMAIYIFSSHKKGISSVQLAKDIDVTQKSAWFMLSRIRSSFKSEVEFEFEGIVQVDETFIGGKNKNRSKNKKVENSQGRSLKTKTPVFGMVCDGLVYTEVIENTRGKTLKPIIRGKVKAGCTIVSDGWMGYRGLSEDYKHKVIQHNLGIFKQGPYHTNSIEGFWSQLKRGIIGIYHYTSPKHLHRYCDEFAYRYNTCKMSDGERFNLSLVNSDIRLMYRDLIAD